MIHVATIRALILTSIGAFGVGYMVGSGAGAVGVALVLLVCAATGAYAFYQHPDPDEIADDWAEYQEGSA